MASNLYKDLQSVLALFTKAEKLRLLTVSFIQFCLAIFDLIGVALIGVVGALSVYGIQSKSPGIRISKFLEMFGLNNQSFQKQVAILSALAALFFICKTVISAFLLRKTLKYTSNRGALLSKKLFKNLILNDINSSHKYTHQQLVYNATNSIDQLSVGVLTSTVTLVSDLGLLISMFLGLLYFDAGISISALVIFVGIFLFSNRILNSSAIKVGKEGYEYAVKANDFLVEFFKTFRETKVRNHEKVYLEGFFDLRQKSARITSARLFFPYVPKFIIEIALVVGGILITGLQLYLTDVTHAVGVLSVFLAASTRIAPAVMRIQQNYTNLKTGLVNTKVAVEFLNLPERDFIERKTDKTIDLFKPKIEIKDLEFKHANSDFSLVVDSLLIAPKTQVAIVGPSGSGKTTLIDLILGIYIPSNGKVLLSGKPPVETFVNWPMSVSYVPQEVAIVNGSIKHNVLLGLSESEYSDEEIWQVLEQVELSSFVRSLPNKLDSQVGESGARISGGQRQRLGIARALVTSPEILILDEATSALDSETEFAITNSLNRIRNKTTLVIIAHRLSTVINSDLIVYMNNGRVVKQGKFQELVDSVPDFAKQAQLMGLV